MRMRAGSVRFDYLNKSFLFDAGELQLREGMLVVVETDFGLDIGTLDGMILEMDLDPKKGVLKKMVRPATPDDLKQMEAMRSREERALAVCEEEIEKAGLGMKLVSVRYSFDGSKVTFCYTADGRVDFRELVRELAQRLRTRIELRQVGVRDEARLFGGVGPCGRPLCCATFLHDFHPVSIRMAKDQGLPLNPLKISGICGRLFCCLKYECDTYVDIRKSLPRMGEDFKQGEVRGRVINVNILKQEVTVETPDNNRVTVFVPLPECPCECPNKSGEPEPEKSAEAPETDEKKDPEPAETKENETREKLSIEATEKINIEVEESGKTEIT